MASPIQIGRIVAVLAAAFLTPAWAAAPLQVQWQRSYGGTNTDTLVDLQKTSDGNFIAVGSSRSGLSGNKTTTNSGDTDGWVIKLDQAGNKLWERSYGGTNTDSFASIRSIPSGGFLV